MDMSTSRYCSIDLEFTGFDPETEQILEIGFAFFDVTDQGIVIGEQWSQVFQPSIEVHPKILGLTGISQEEIDNAPNVSEFREFLSEKLRDKILVAHNPVLDVKFLQQAGVELSGRVIDTLELVQFLLPTHHSYNLENLTHYFDIKHQGSHRALGDSLSVIALLERLLGIYVGLPAEVQKQLQEVCGRGEFEWVSLFNHQLAPADSQGRDSLAHDVFAEDVLPGFDEPVIIDSNHYLHESRVAKTLQAHNQPSLLVMPSKQEVLRLWRAGIVEGVFESKDLFNETAFRAFLQSAQTSEELRFCLKILVWQATNWQTKTVLDLNLSFFGGQFKANITDGAYQASTAHVAACDYQTFVELASANLETNRELVICDLQRFERFLTFGSRERLSWNYFNFVVKSIYNPETGFGHQHLKDLVVDTLTAVDLFFGLVQIMLRQSSKQTDYIGMSDLEVLQPVYYRRLVAAASHLAEKLTDLSSQADHQKLQELAGELSRFFELEENRVKWVELTEDNVVMHSQPILIEQLAQNYFSQFPRVKLTETVSNQDLLFYLCDRLGFNPEIFENLEFSESVAMSASEASADDVLNVIHENDAPSVVVFPSPAAAKAFYKEHFLVLKEKFRLFGQEYSGSGNKIFRNFRIADNSLLLATSQFINKQRFTAPAKTVVYLKQPQVDIAQPYFSALQQAYQDKYENLAEILATSDYILNLKQLSGNSLPKVILLASK